MIDELLQQSLAHIEQLRRLPVSTYRLQLHAKFTFRDAIAVLPYLHDLGITHVYCSPYLKATPGSMHGYDVIDHGRLNDEIGSESEYSHFVSALKEHELQQLLDTVPNHVGIDTNENHWFNDVLAHGRESRYANHFDIAWNGSPRKALHDKLMLPVLGRPYAQVLEKGELKLVKHADQFWVQYYDRRFPLSPESTSDIRDPNEFVGTPGDAASFDRLDALLARQHYRLCWWESAPDEINYRRFFNVNTLAALKMERLEVFEETHALTMNLLADGRVAGLRIDHPDGLADPKQYFDRLQNYYVLAVAKAIFDAQPEKNEEDWVATREQLQKQLSQRDDRPLYVAVEKILGLDEPLPADWAVSGTTGYDFLAMANALFVDPAAEKPLTDFYAKLIGFDESFEDLIYRKKRLILEVELVSELRMLATQLAELAQRDRRSIDFTVNALQMALRETIASFPVYRTYVRPGVISGQDRTCIESAIAAAIKRNAGKDPTVFEYLRDVVLLHYPRLATPDDRALQEAVVLKFQQLTSPTTAKGIEDTSFYIYNRLTSLNEVGGNPGVFSVSPSKMHAYLRDRQAKWPLGLSPLTTHDTKRSEDVRTRITALSEIPSECQSAVLNWFTINEPLRKELPSGIAPSRNDEYLLYQTLIGAWPIGTPTADEYADFAKRISAYMLKAMREAKVRTSWTHPDSEYEKAVDAFIDGLLDQKRSAEFFETFLPLARRMSDIGIVNSLSQTLLRLTSPGVPDTYQGSELWDLSLVDPDNRRPVDYAKRRKMLADLQKSWASQNRSVLAAALWKSRADGGIKQFLIWRLTTERRKRPALFTSGEYVPLNAEGPGADRLFCFLRRHGDDFLLVVAPRLTAPLGPWPWPAEAFAGVKIPGLPDVMLYDLFSGQPYAVNSLSGSFPVGVYASWV